MRNRYQQFLYRTRKIFGVSQEEARYAYQEAKAVLGRAPGARDFVRLADFVDEVLTSVGAFGATPLPVASTSPVLKGREGKRVVPESFPQPEEEVEEVEPGEVELTFKKIYSGEGPRGGRIQRLVQLKLRVRTEWPMTDDQIFAAVKRAARTRIVPPGIELDILDWQSGTAYRMRGGGYIGDRAADALHDFYGFVRVADTRIERIGE